MTETGRGPGPGNGRFLEAHGHVTAIGVEGTSSYGAGFTSAARSHGHRVVEVNRPDRAERRRIGKSDPVDAYAAARAALSGRASSAPKDDTVTGIRALHNAARSAVKARTTALTRSPISSSPHLRASAPSTGSSWGPTEPTPLPGCGLPAARSTSRSSPRSRSSPDASRR